MFAQVIQGRTSDAKAFRSAMDRWVHDLAPSSIGWLGSTGGVTDDGRFIEVARFESADAAGRNSARPEQSRWWQDTQQTLEGAATFADSEDVTVDMHGDPDRAGFVQVMRGRVTDAARARELMDRMNASDLARLRPDILGTLSVRQDDGEWTQVIYFTSEAAAREGERKEMPAEAKAVMDELMAISDGPPEFFDLREPVLDSPR
ncbi:MAG TPA: hypothetical protein VGN28_10780 [Blastococcus sp.]|jgi:hypothetical protein|nr:hypothetical protein [Blastococcus sp.]